MAINIAVFAFSVHCLSVTVRNMTQVFVAHANIQFIYRDLYILCVASWSKDSRLK